MKTVAIIGAGPLGRWLALAAARAGYRVLLEDVMPANLHHAEEYLRQQLGPDALSRNSNPDRNEDAAASTVLVEAPPVEFVSSIEDAVRDADLAIDCVPDELESKLEILWLLDRMAPPKTVIATPTTHLSIADLASCTYRPEKCIAIAADIRQFSQGDHRQRPGEILLRSTSGTSPEALDLVTDFWKNVGFATQVELTGA